MSFRKGSQGAGKQEGRWGAWETTGDWCLLSPSSALAPAPGRGRCLLVWAEKGAQSTGRHITELAWVKGKLLSRLQLFGTPWTLYSMEFSRPEYWSG